MDNIVNMTQNLALPMTELMTFDGDPKNCYNFMTAFESNIARRVADPATKLTYFILVQYCTGKANKAIANRVILDALLGYSRILELLKEQFGKLYDIARAYRERGVHFLFAGVKMPVFRVMKRSGFDAVLGEEAFFFDVHSAMLHAQESPLPGADDIPSTRPTEDTRAVEKHGGAVLSPGAPLPQGAAGV